MDKVKALIAEYGYVALGVYLTLYAITLAVLITGIIYGAKVDSGGGMAATIGTAWVASRASMPLRILATAAITPVVARLLGKGKKTPPADPPAPAK